MSKKSDNLEIKCRVIGMIGIKENTCWDEHSVLYTTNELLNTAINTYVQYAG